MVIPDSRPSCTVWRAGTGGAWGARIRRVSLVGCRVTCRSSNRICNTESKISRISLSLSLATTMAARPASPDALEQMLASAYMNMKRERRPPSRYDPSDPEVWIFKDDPVGYDPCVLVCQERRAGSVVSDVRPRWPPGKVTVYTCRQHEGNSWRPPAAAARRLDEEREERRKGHGGGRKACGSLSSHRDAPHTAWPTPRLAGERDALQPRGERGAGAARRRARPQVEGHWRGAGHHGGRGEGQVRPAARARCRRQGPGAPPGCATPVAGTAAAAPPPAKEGHIICRFRL